MERNVLFNGIIKNNPVFVLLLGMCPTLATTTSVVNGLGMGVSTMLVLVMSNIFVSLLRKFIPENIRIACFVVIIAGFVTFLDMMLKAFLPSLSSSLGIFIPLIVVNCIVLARADAFASKNNWYMSALDGLGVGAGFALALVLLASVREILGVGSFAGIKIFSGAPLSIMIMPTGGFIALGLLIALFVVLKEKIK